MSHTENGQPEDLKVELPENSNGMTSTEEEITDDASGEDNFEDISFVKPVREMVKAFDGPLEDFYEAAKLAIASLLEFDVDMEIKMKSMTLEERMLEKEKRKELMKHQYDDYLKETEDMVKEVMKQLDAVKKENPEE